MSTKLPEDLFFVWDMDDFDSSFYEDVEPRPLYVCCLCRDTDTKPDLIRGYDPRDGIFERPGVIVESLGGIDLDDNEPARSDYKRRVEAELLDEFEARREANTQRSNN